jgi:hypothetical protein
MKKLLIIFFFMVIVLTPKLVAQSQDDQALVLQKCIDLPELQQYYPLNEEGSLKPLYIVQYPVSFPSDLAIEKEGTIVKFMTSSDITINKVAAYFMFRSFNIHQNSANINCNYFYNYNYTSKQFKMLSVIIEMKKVGLQWNISTINIKGDTI